jgi:hypothetical protein
VVTGGGQLARMPPCVNERRSKTRKAAAKEEDSVILLVCDPLIGPPGQPKRVGVLYISSSWILDSISHQQALDLSSPYRLQ